MTFTLICNDKKNCLEKRKKLRERHVLYLKRHKENILIAGPILDEYENPIGSLLIVNFKNKTEVQKFLKNDPYNLQGLFEKVKVIKFKQVI